MLYKKSYKIIRTSGLNVNSHCRCVCTTNCYLSKADNLQKGNQAPEFT